MVRKFGIGDTISFLHRHNPVKSFIFDFMNFEDGHYLIHVHRKRVIMLLEYELKLTRRVLIEKDIWKEKYEMSNEIRRIRKSNNINKYIKNGIL